MGRRRADRLHGVEVRKRPQGSPVDPRASEIPIRRICVGYDDGRRVCFVPEAGEEFFVRDAARRVVGMLHIGSEALEFGLTKRERYPGTGLCTTPAPYNLLGPSIGLSGGTLARQRTVLRPPDRHPDQGVHHDEHPAHHEHPPDGAFWSAPRHAEPV
jgi:hypothetical protein